MNKNANLRQQKSHGFCYRCDWRALYLETGHGPRCECQDPRFSSAGCYMYRPVRPVQMKRRKGDRRPVGGPPFIAARCDAGPAIDKDKWECVAHKVRGGIVPYWRPKDG